MDTNWPPGYKDQLLRGSQAAGNTYEPGEELQPGQEHRYEPIVQWRHCHSKELEEPASTTAWRWSEIASMCQLFMNGWAGSMLGQLAFVNSLNDLRYFSALTCSRVNPAKCCFN